MQLALSKCMRVGVSSLAFLEALEDLKTFLLDPGCNMDGVDFTKFLDENDGIVSRLPNMSLQEWALILDIFSTLLSKRTEIPNYEFCRLAAAILKCMYNHTSPAFWDLCLKRFLCKMDARSISSPSLIIHVIVNHSTDINACLQDPTINATFSHFLLTVIEAHGLHKEAFDFSEYTKLGRFIQLMLRFVRQGHSDVLELLATLSGSIIETSFRLQVPKTTLLSKEFFETSQGIVLFTLKYFKCNPTAGLTSLRNLIHLNPKILLLKPVHIHLVDFLLSLLRAPVCSSSTKQNIPCSPTDALSLFSDLLQQIEEFGLKEAVTLPMYMNFFDILRAFPVDESHSISRLYVWWRFICLLPSQMLSGGFRRFVSPFLANLLGRYISITACLGDPILHRYQLSSTSVYNGDARAQELAVHVFSCLFNYSPITLKQASNEEPLPRFSSPPHFLSEHSYQLLVAACHWLRYVSGSDRFTCSPKIGEIWLTYLKQIQNAALAFKPDDETLKGTFLHHFVDLSVRLITPHLQNCASTSFGSLIVPSVEDISCSPTTNDCVIILHGVIGIVENEKISSELKTTLNFNICVSCLHLLSLRHRSSVSSPMSAEHTFMDELSRLSIQLAEKDYRLAVEHSPIVNTCDHLKLFQELLSALAPDCIHFIRDTLVPDSSQDSIPPKSSIRSVNTRLNEAGIRAWCFLADRLARLTSLHKRVVELPKPGTESVGIPDTPTSDLFTMVAFCLAPLFLAGNSTCSLSSDQEQKILGSLFGLFGAFHAEACLLTTVPINSWINQLGGLLFELIKDTNPEAPKEVNLNIAANFLIFMVKSAEGVEENAKGRFSPSKWLARVGKPLGQMSGPVEAISQCLGLIPMEQFEISPKSMVSSTPRTRGRRQRSLSVRAPALEPLSPTRLCESAFADDAHQQQSDHRPPLLCGLLRSLWLVLQRHVQSAEAAFHLIELSSSGLLALAKYLTAESTAVTDVEAHAAVVTAFEAFFTLAWHRLQKYLFKSEEAEDSKNQPNEESKPLNLPESAISQMMVFLEAAVCLASSPVSPLDPHNAATKCIGQCASPKPRKSGCCGAILSRRREMFISCIVSLWNTLVTSTPTQASDLRSKLCNLASHFALCLNKEAVSLRKRAVFPCWIPLDCLAVEDLNEENALPPTATTNSSSRQVILGKSRDTIDFTASKAIDGGDEENLTLAEFQRRLRKKSGSHPHQEGDVLCDTSNGSSQISPSQNPPNKSVFGSFLSSRRFGASAGPKLTSPQPSNLSSSLRMPLVGRRRLSLDPREVGLPTTPIKRSVPSSELRSFEVPATTTSDDVKLNSGEVRRRLFSGGVDDANCLCGTPAASTTLSVAQRGKKRAQTNDLAKTSLPNFSELDDSAQFVFIPPPNIASKRMRLTEHQKERRLEQKQAYIPSMYNDLDASHQSLSSQVCNSDSRSSMESSQSFMQYPQPPESKPSSQSLTMPAAVNYSSAVEAPFPIAASVYNAPLPFEETQEKPATETTTGPETVCSQGDDQTDYASAKAVPREVVSTDSKHYDSKEAFEEASVPLHTEPSQNTAPPSSPVALLNHLRNMAAAPSPSSPGLSGSPMVSRATPALLKSPLLGGAMGKRAQKILEMGLAKAAERSKQRQSLPALAKSSTATSPAPVPDDQPGSRPGILRNLTTPRPRTRVSFASQPVVFILNSPSKPSPDEGSQTTNPTKPVSPPSANAHVSASSEANKVKSVVDNQSQGLLQAEFSSPSIEVTPPSHNESGVSPLKSAVIQPALPEEIAMPFSTTANDISKSSSSPPFLPIGSRRRRKSASPRRRDPIDRSSRDALRHSLPNGIAGSFVRPLNCRHPFASVDNDTIAVQEKATMADKNNVDLDSTNAEDLAQSSITMSTKESNADKSQHSTTSETTLLESSQSFDFVATTQEEVEDSVLKSMSTTSVAFDHVKAKAQEVSELESAAATGHNDFVGSSQELNSVDEVLVADTEPEQIANQPMCDSMDTTLAAVDTQEILSNKHGAEEKSTQPKMVELARQTLTTLKSQLSALTTEQKKELLFETLALFKSIIP